MATFMESSTVKNAVLSAATTPHENDRGTTFKGKKAKGEHAKNREETNGQYKAGGHGLRGLNVEAHEKEVEEIQAKMRQLRNELNGIQKDIDSTSNVKDSYQAKWQELKEKLNGLRGEQKKANEVKMELVQQLKEHTKLRDKQVEGLTTMRAKLQFKSMEEVDRAVKQLESKIESEGVTVMEERKLLSEISNLRKLRTSVKEYKDRFDALDNDKKNSQQVRDQLKAAENEAYRVKGLADSVFVELNALQKQREGDFGKVNEKFSGRSKIIKQLDEERQKLNAIITQFRLDRDEAWKKSQEERTRRAEEAKMKRERFEIERRAAQLEREQEIAEIPPFIDEISVCSTLASYLQPLSGKQEYAGADQNNNHDNDADKNQSSSVALPVDLQGGIMLKKKSDRNDDVDAFFGSLAKKKDTKQKKDVKKKEKNEPLKHPLSILEDFIKLQISTPNTPSDIPSTLEALRKKKEYFEQEQKEIMRSRIAKLTQQQQQQQQQQEQRQEHDTTEDVDEQNKLKEEINLESEPSKDSLEEGEIRE